jgi:DNA modification methylase
MSTVLDQIHTDRFSIYNGDCVEVVSGLPDDSIDFSVYSPPFSSLYIYSDSERDMGNCRDDAEFFEHYRFLIREKYRATRPGRLTAVHCKQLVDYANSAGHAGWRDFRGDIIRAHQAEGWVYHCEVVIWKCPVNEMTKTKCQRLLYKQLRTDSSHSGVGIPEYLILFRKWAEKDKEVPIRKSAGDFPLEQWQEWASPVWPVWMDINQTRVLNGKIARDDKDEKHICPLQLDVIERAITMWTNPADVVLSPFMGVGSEGYVAMQLGRRFVGVELKPEYFALAKQHIEAAIAEEPSMFSEEDFA